jgi:hypothetical protein
MLVRPALGWAWVKAMAMVSRPLPAYFTYGRSAGLRIRVRAGLQVEVPVFRVENDGLKLPPRQNR